MVIFDDDSKFFVALALVEKPEANEQVEKPLEEFVSCSPSLCKAPPGIFPPSPRFGDESLAIAVEPQPPYLFAPALQQQEEEFGQLAFLSARRGKLPIKSIGIKIEFGFPTWSQSTYKFRLFLVCSDYAQLQAIKKLWYLLPPKPPPPVSALWITVVYAPPDALEIFTCFSGRLRLWSSWDVSVCKSHSMLLMASRGGLFHSRSNNGVEGVIAPISDQNRSTQKRFSDDVVAKGRIAGFFLRRFCKNQGRDTRFPAAYEPTILPKKVDKWHLFYHSWPHYSMFSQKQACSSHLWLLNLAPPGSVMLLHTQPQHLARMNLGRKPGTVFLSSGLLPQRSIDVLISPTCSTYSKAMSCSQVESKIHLNCKGRLPSLAGNPRLRKQHCEYKSCPLWRNQVSHKLPPVHTLWQSSTGKLLYPIQFASALEKCEENKIHISKGMESKDYLYTAWEEEFRFRNSSKSLFPPRYSNLLKKQQILHNTHKVKVILSSSGDLIAIPWITTKDERSWLHMIRESKSIGKELLSWSKVRLKKGMFKEQKEPEQHQMKSPGPVREQARVKT